MNDVRIHRDDCKGFDERINCVGCFKAEAIEVIRIAHDHMIMEPRSVAHTRSYKMVKDFLDRWDVNNE